MKTYEWNKSDGRTVFSVIVDQFELQDAANAHSLFNRFREHVLTKLGSMIAAYYFKHHKEELLAFVSSDEFKAAIVQEISKRILVKVEIDGHENNRKT